MAHRSFGSTNDEGSSHEEVTFDVGECENLYGREQVNGKLMMDLVAKVDSPSVGLQAEGITDVFGIVLRTDDGDDTETYSGRRHHTPAQRQSALEKGLTPGVDPTSSLGRLTEYLDDPNTYIEIEELANIVGWLVEQYTNRPTKSSSSSAAGTSSTSPTSTGGRRLPAGSSAKKTSVGASTS